MPAPHLAPSANSAASRRTIQSRTVPSLSLRAGALVGQAAALALVIGMAVWLRGYLSLSSPYPLKTAASFGILMVMTWAYVDESHPFSGFGAANWVTTARAALVALLLAFIAEPETSSVAAIIVFAAVIVTLLDGVDGWLARRHATASEFGARFDMEIDAVLILALAILVWEHGKAGAWVILSGLLRYLFVAAGWVRPWMQRPLPPTLRGKIVCVVQIAALILAMMPLVTPAVGSGIAALGLAALCYSFSVDTIWLWRQTHRRGTVYSRTR